MTGPPTGRHLGPKLADLAAEARIKARAATLPAETEYRADERRSFMEQVEHELAPTFRQVFADVVNDPDTPEQAKAILGPLLQPEHQGQFFLTVAAIVGLALSGPAAAAAGWLQRLQNQSFKAHGDLRLGPEEAAVAFVKGYLTQGEAEAEARVAGMTPEVWRVLASATGDPPGLMQLLEAFRRGYVDRDRLHHGIRQSRVKNEWIDVVEALRFAPPGVGQVVAAAVEGHLSQPDAARRIGEAGVDPKEFGWLYETAGRPPGTHELLDLMDRGEISQTEVEQAIRESDVKNKYIPSLIKLARKIPPMRTVVAMVHQAVITPEVGLRKLAELGFDHEDASALVQEALNRKSEKTRDLAKGEIEALYLLGAVDRAKATALLSSMGYDADESNMILNLAEAGRFRRHLESAIGRVRSAYVGHHIDRTTTSNDLDHLGVAVPQRDALVALWDTERSTQVRLLTEAQVVRAYKARLIDDAEFVRRHVAMGYTDDDARLLLALSQPAATTA